MHVRFGGGGRGREGARSQYSEETEVNVEMSLSCENGGVEEDKKG